MALYNAASAEGLDVEEYVRRREQMAYPKSPEHDLKYRALAPLKFGDGRLNPGDIIPKTNDPSVWPVEAIRSCVSQRLIEAIGTATPGPGQFDEPPVSLRSTVDPWNGAKPADDEPKGEPVTSKSVQRRKAIQKKGAKAKAKTGSAKVDETGRPLLPGELTDESARQAERLRVAKIGLRAVPKEDATGRIDLTDETPTLFPNPNKEE